MELVRRCVRQRGRSLILRKEVIQPQVPLRLPCYDLVPIDRFAVAAYLPSIAGGVGTASSGAPIFRGLTGGVYKAQEHIHRSVADLRLLAIPTSRRRVAAFDLNWGVFFEICSPSRVGIPLYMPLQHPSSPGHKGHQRLTSSRPPSGLPPA